MASPLPQPPAWRVAAAFLVAPGLAAVVLACMTPLYNGLPLPERILRSAVTFAIFGAYPATLLFGLPAYFLLRSRLRPRAWICAFIGAVVAAAPFSLLSLLSTPDYAYSGGQVTVMDGRITFWGYVQRGRFVGMIGLFGALAGFLFWLIAVAGARLAPRTQPEPEPG